MDDYFLRIILLSSLVVFQILHVTFGCTLTCFQPLTGPLKTHAFLGSPPNDLINHNITSQAVGLPFFCGFCCIVFYINMPPFFFVAVFFFCLHCTLIALILINVQLQNLKNCTVVLRTSAQQINKVPLSLPFYSLVQPLTLPQKCDLMWQCRTMRWTSQSILLFPSFWFRPHSPNSEK